MEYSQEYGITLSVGVMTHPGQDSAVYLKGQVGEKQRAILLGYGINIKPDISGNFLVEHLEQDRSLNSNSYKVSQDKIGISFKFVPKESVIKNINGKITFSQSGDTSISDTYVIVDSATIFDQSISHNKFIGLRQSEALISGTFDI